MRALLDINVLIALLDVDHPQHYVAGQWLAANIKDGWASCPLTQNGCIRIMSQPAYPNSFPAAQVAARLSQACGHEAHQFWPNDISLLDENRIDVSCLLGPKQITDIYLVALAVKHRGRFVTFDDRLSLAAIRGAKAQHLVVL